MKRNASIPFAFCSLIRTLDKVLSLENEKKCKHSFCILLAYPYLCIDELFTKMCRYACIRLRLRAGGPGQRALHPCEARDWSVRDSTLCGLMSAGGFVPRSGDGTHHGGGILSGGAPQMCRLYGQRRSDTLGVGTAAARYSQAPRGAAADIEEALSPVAAEQHERDTLGTVPRAAGRLLRA